MPHGEQEQGSKTRMLTPNGEQEQGSTAMMSTPCKQQGQSFQGQVVVNGKTDKKGRGRIWGKVDKGLS